MVHYTASEMWTRTRGSPEGASTLRTLMRQLIQGVADCHRRNVTHRDLKPENLIVHIPTPDEAELGGRAANPVLKLADFGSAVNEESIRYDPHKRNAALFRLPFFQLIRPQKWEDSATQIKSRCMGSRCRLLPPGRTRDNSATPGTKNRIPAK